MRRTLFRLGRQMLFVMVAVTLAVCSRGAAHAEAVGDCNGDGQASAADAAILFRAAKSVNVPETLDLTQNGVVDGTDARVLLHLAAGNIEDLVSFVELNASGLTDEKDFDRYSYTGVVRSGYDYRSENVSVTVTEHDEDKLVYYVADIYVRNLSSFRTALSNGQNRGKYQSVADMAAENGAILAINGDFYKARGDGPIVRNGEFIRKNYKQRFDQCVMTYDGVIQTYARGALRLNALEALKPYQMWLFGPRLLDDDGNAIVKFSSALANRNPRTAIGYYSPGHYCFMLVDGRQAGYSGGITLANLSKLFFALGCKAAYNLDGGQTSAMATADSVVNMPYRGGRILSDIIYIAEPLSE